MSTLPNAVILEQEMDMNPLSLCVCVCVLQVCRREFTGDHESHVVLWRFPLDPGERPAGSVLRSAHPHRGAALDLLRRHPGHHDDVLHCSQTREQQHSRLGQ